MTDGPAGTRAAGHEARRRRWRDDAALALGLALLAALVAANGWAWRGGRLLYDVGLSAWNRPTPPDIVIIAVDDASLEAIGRWPWRRAVHATLLQQVAAAGPLSIALDLVLSEPDDDPAQDALLAQALADATPVVMPMVWQPVGPGAWRALAPVSPLREVVALGVAEAAVDADGVLRHAFLRSGPAGNLQPHLALQMLQAAGETVHARVGPQAAPAVDGPPGVLQRDGRFLVRYAGPPGTVERVSYVDVLAGQVPPGRLAGRHVLIGMTAQGLGDTLATPVNARHQAMPGVEVLAQTLHTLRSGDAMAELSTPATAAASALLAALLVPALRRVGPRAALPLAVGSVPLAFGASLLALGAGCWVNPLPYALAALLAYPLWSWRRLEQAMRAVDAEVEQLAAEPALAVPLAGSRAAVGDVLDRRLQTLQRAGRLAREGSRFLVETLAAMPTAMLVGDAQGRVLLANARAALLFEVDRADDLQGLDLLRLLSEFDAPAGWRWDEALAALVPDAAASAAEVRLGESGHHVVHLAAVALLGQPRVVVSIADIEPVKQAQRQREEVLAFVSHDLRSPASGIVMLADLHLSGRLQTPRDELLAEIRRLAQRTLTLSEDFVHVAQAQMKTLVPEAMAPAELVAQGIDDLRPQAAAAGVTIDVHADARGTVQVDRALVGRAIANLVSNAIKHSPAGSCVRVEAAVVGGAGGGLRVSVRDRGPGLSEAQRAELARGDAGATVARRGGVGLGLQFVQRVAARHGGRLQASQPTDGGGACVELLLPQPHLQPQPQPKLQPQPPQSGNP